MEGKTGFAGDPAARSRSRQAEAEEAGAEACLGERRGKAPRPPPSRVRGDEALACARDCHPKGRDAVFSGSMQIPMHRGHLLRFDRGQATDLMAATIPI